MQLKIHLHVYDISLFSSPLWEGSRNYLSQLRNWDCERCNTWSQTNSHADQSGFGPRSSDSKPKALSAPVNLTSVPRWPLTSVSSLPIFPLVWSHGQCELVLKEGLKFFFHLKHSVIDHGSSTSSLQSSMPRDPSVPHNDYLWLRDQGGHLTQRQRPSVAVPDHSASLLQEFDMRDTESVVRLMESPEAESSGWLGDWGGYFGATWKMTK